MIWRLFSSLFPNLSEFVTGGDKSLSVIEENYENNGTFVFWQGTLFILQLYIRSSRSCNPNVRGQREIKRRKNLPICFILSWWFCQAQPQFHLSQTQPGTEFLLNLASSNTNQPTQTRQVVTLLIAICYLPLPTSYLLFASCCLLLATCNLLFTTCYLLLASCYLLLSTATHHLILASCCLLLGTF